jgi:hypothetical protein
MAIPARMSNANKEIKRMKATLEVKQIIYKRVTRRNERLGMITPKENKGNKKKEKVATALHH